jgi:type IV pilus assembly protein PilE
MERNPQRGFTVAEILTALVVVAVLTAIAIPMWRAHVLRVQRTEARDALIALQAAQDGYFGRHARYATAAQLTAKAPDGLGLKESSENGLFAISLTTHADGLGYLATARATPRNGQDTDARCVEFSIDQVGQMRAQDSTGADRSADCWH